MRILRRSVVLALVLMMGAVLMGCRTGRESDLQVGPNLVSEVEAGRLARKETPLVDIVDSCLQTCGPVYRVLKGRTDSGREIVVWVSDRVVAQAYSDEGMSTEEAIQRVKDLFPGSGVDRVQLVYIPDSGKASAAEEIRTAPGNIFWQVTCGLGNTDSRVEHFVPLGRP